MKDIAADVSRVLEGNLGETLDESSTRLADIVLREFVELAFRVAASDRGSYLHQTGMIRWIFAGLVEHEWIGSGITNAEVTARLLAEAEREGSEYNPSVMRRSQILLALREGDRNDHTANAGRYENALVEIGNLVASTDCEITPLERQQIEQYVHRA